MERTLSLSPPPIPNFFRSYLATQKADAHILGPQYLPPLVLWIQGIPFFNIDE